ncbi:type I-B CRISPR-associated protein Cas5b [Aminipila sp.]|uniref:type I-B CRISPR-associated protein Cas5b n=1 Tax=Aminipila sp. TaxID=2060095 RepID=UPI0028962DA4|nr:type I-B CRISPR-associated protein Cas5b [Aminipila sp.]
MEVIKFTLKGRTAFFKKHEVNTYFYFTYGNIHKVALLGMLGAIYGYGGYNQQKKETKKIKGDPYPEFYDKLKHLKTGIIPARYIFDKKVQSFNNSVGYASKEQGGNLIVKEQWLENPEWDIYLLLDNKEAQEVANCLLFNQFKFIPYLGKNEHFADITNVQLFKGVMAMRDPKSLNSLFRKDEFSFDMVDGWGMESSCFKYEEKLPIALEEKTNRYELESFVFTDRSLTQKKESLVYQIEGKNIAFF